MGCRTRVMGNGLLHVRGGVSGKQPPNDDRSPVFSTSVEVFPFGDVVGSVFGVSSPRPWRCFCQSHDPKARCLVFSTSVEVFLQPGAGARFVSSLLHVRGGVSSRRPNAKRVRLSSPRPWRCFPRQLRSWRNHRVFSTSVEVFLKVPQPRVTCRGLLHVRGGVSRSASGLPAVMMSSPRPWRCFLVGRHLRKVDSSLLHVRGGVSEVKGEPDQGSLSSPRPWRCFQDGFERLLGRGVFSTSVEVFLDRFVPSKSASSLLHVRGGVSYRAHAWCLVCGSSPRPWRCFQEASRHLRRSAVFSTSVEVFL